MGFIGLIIGVWLISYAIELQNNLAIISIKLNVFCLDLTDSDWKWNFIYQSLICGKKLPTEEAYTLKKLGLIHLYVVSGLHIHYIEGFIKKVSRTYPKFHCLKYPVLLLYGLSTSMNPPILRALISSSLKDLNSIFKLNWPTSLVCFLTGSICICLFNNLISSFSLCLSWCAAVAIHISADITNTKSLFKSHLITCLCVYVFSTPLILNLTLLHPLSILVNLFLAPIFSLLLFPLILIAGVFPFFRTISDPIWSWHFKLLDVLKSHIPYTDITSNTSLEINWTYLLLLNIFFIYFQIHKNRLRL